MARTGRMAGLAQRRPFMRRRDNGSRRRVIGGLAAALATVAAASVALSWRRSRASMTHARPYGGGL
jgi:hypothetical protein